jgi:hypothetical protein
MHCPSKHPRPASQSHAVWHCWPQRSVCPSVCWHCWPSGQRSDSQQKSDAVPATQCPPSQVRPGEQSHAVRHCVLRSGTQTWTAQSAQVGQLGTHVHRYPVGQLAAPFAGVPQVEIGAGQTRSSFAGSLARAAGNSPTTPRQRASTSRTLMNLRSRLRSRAAATQHIPNSHAARRVATRDWQMRRAFRMHSDRFLAEIRSDAITSRHTFAGSAGNFPSPFSHSRAFPGR